MKQRHSFFTATGIPSLFLIFSVLCLAVLSLLTLGTSRSELNLARQSMQQTEDYYTACSQASTALTEFQTKLQAAYQKADNQHDFFLLVEQLAKETSASTFDSKEQTLCFHEKLSDTQQLTVKLKILYPESDNRVFTQILEWKTDSTASWNPDTSQSVYKGGKS